MQKRFISAVTNTGVPFIRDRQLKITHWNGRLNHRADYSPIRWMQVAEWLNEREAGYPRKNQK